MRDMKVHVLDVGHGDTIILEMPIGDTDTAYGVIDCVEFEDVTGPYLEKLKVDKLAFVCGTHPHDDHIRDIKKLLEAYEGKVGEYWDSGKEHTLPEYLELVEYLDTKNIQTEFVRSGNMIRFGKTKLHSRSASKTISRFKERKLQHKQRFNCHSCRVWSVENHSQR